jgi:hypothetical protein
VEKTWKPTTAGVLNIITGALSFFGAFGMGIGLIFVSSNSQFIFSAREMPFALPTAALVLSVLTFLSVVYTVLTIVGGVFALQRKRWGWALAGSIVAILSVLPLGVLSTIFVALSKEEFEQSETAGAGNP